MKNKKFRYGLMGVATVGVLSMMTYASSRMADTLMKRQNSDKKTKEPHCFDDAKLVHVMNSEHQLLCGYYYENNSDLTIIVMHPYNLSAKAMMSYIRYFTHNFNCNILAVDILNHGSSDGNVHQLGFSDDIVCWVNYLIGSHHENIILFGKEMGANAILNNTKVLKSIKQVKGIISDGAYTSVKEVLNYRLQKDYYILKFPFVGLMKWIVKWRYHIDIDELDTIKQIEKNTIPTLFVHTQKDVFVPMKQVFKLYNALQAKKELLVLKGETYLFDLENKPHDGYLNTLSRFIKECMD